VCKYFTEIPAFLLFLKSEQAEGIRDLEVGSPIGQSLISAQHAVPLEEAILRFYGLTRINKNASNLAYCFV